MLTDRRLYPVVGSVSSRHTIVEIGAERTVEVGDPATLIGPDDPAIESIAVARKTGGPLRDDHEVQCALAASPGLRGRVSGRKRGYLAVGGGRRCFVAS